MDYQKSVESDIYDVGALFDCDSTRSETMKLFISFLISAVAVSLFWYLVLTFSWTVAIYAIKSALVVILLTALMQLFVM